MVTPLLIAPIQSWTCSIRTANTSTTSSMWTKGLQWQQARWSRLARRLIWRQCALVPRVVSTMMSPSVSSHLSPLTVTIPCELISFPLIFNIEFGFLIGGPCPKQSAILGKLRPVLNWIKRSSTRKTGKIIFYCRQTFSVLLMKAWVGLRHCQLHGDQWKESCGKRWHFRILCQEDLGGSMEVLCLNADFWHLAWIEIN